MPSENVEMKKLIERLSTVGEQLSKSVVALEKLDINWELIPAVPGPLGLGDQACTQNNQCEPNPGCHQNSAC